MALSSPINPAFPNDRLRPNLVRGGFGSLSNITNRAVYDIHGLDDARSLVFFFDRGNKKKISAISFSLSWYNANGNRTQTEGKRVLQGRIAIIRNPNFDPARVVADPVFDDDTPLLTTTATGVDWTFTNDVNDPVWKRLNWTQNDIVWQIMTDHEENQFHPIEFGFSEGESCAVVFTPVYMGSRLSTSTGIDFATPTNVGLFEGTGGGPFGFDNRLQKAVRTLNVMGCY